MTRLDLGRNPYGRYLYTFVHALTRAGRRVAAVPRPRFLLDTWRDPYARFLFTHQGFGWGFGGDPLDIRMEYFSEEAVGRRIPIGMHPLMVRKGWWNAPLDGIPRQRAVFFAGNTDVALYSDGGLERRFGVAPRSEVLAKVADVITWRDSRTDPIPMEQWRPVLAGYDYFLALPGVVMPHAHNLTEAMSAGCVPVMQAAHAAWMDPPLRHGVNAWLYARPEEAPGAIREALAADDATMARLRAGAMSYYESNLSPEAVVRIASQAKRLYLMAEHHSLPRL